MKSLRLLVLFLIGMAVTAFLTSIGTERWLIFTIVILFYLTAMLLPGIFTVYYSNSLGQIERYIKRNRHKAIFGFPYALGYGDGQDIDKALQRILAVHQQPVMQSVYRTLLAIYREQPRIAAQHAERINREPLRSYYMAHAAVASGDLQRAALLNEGISVPWMNHSIAALIAFEVNDDKFDALANQSIAAARGVQKYTLAKSFSRMKKL